MYNKVILMGNLTKDIELRYLQSGSVVGSTAIATNRRWKSQSGEQKEEVMYIDLTLFGRTAEIANQYLHKGSKVLIDGRLSFEQWTAQDGSRRSKHAIIVENLKMLPREGEQGGGSRSGYGDASKAVERGYRAPDSTPSPQNKQPQSTQEIPEIDINEDEIPF
jgi:single-strand DNA-binding protein